MLLFQRSDYLFSFDLKSGYHQVDIDQIHRSCLRFSWKGRFFVFHCVTIWSMLSRLHFLLN